MLELLSSSLIFIERNVLFMKNKTLLIVFLAIILLFGITCVCSANVYDDSVTTEILEDKSLSLTINSINYIIPGIFDKISSAYAYTIDCALDTTGKLSRVYINIFNEPVDFYLTPYSSDNKIKTLKYTTPISTCYYYTAFSDNPVWIEDADAHLYPRIGGDNSRFLFCSNDIYTDSSLTSVSYEKEVFQLPPQEKTLAPIVEGIPMEGTLMEIVKLIPIVIMTIVGLISLRKALQVLSTFLRNS